MTSVLYKTGDGLRDNKIRGMRWCGRSSHVRRRLLSSRLIPETGPGSGFHTAWTPQCCLGPLSGAGAGLAGTDAERLTPRPQYIAWANIVAYAPWRVIATALLGRVRGCLTRAAAFLEAASLQPTGRCGASRVHCIDPGRSPLQVSRSQRFSRQGLRYALRQRRCVNEGFADGSGCCFVGMRCADDLAVSNHPAHKRSPASVTSLTNFPGPSKSSPGSCANVGGAKKNRGKAAAFRVYAAGRAIRARDAPG